MEGVGDMHVPVTGHTLKLIGSWDHKTLDVWHGLEAGGQWVASSRPIRATAPLGGCAGPLWMPRRLAPCCCDPVWDTRPKGSYMLARGPKGSYMLARGVLRVGMEARRRRRRGRMSREDWLRGQTCCNPAAKRKPRSALLGPFGAALRHRSPVGWLCSAGTL
eukprot:236038-Chlamydomonas_euryale.AAC.1